MAKPVLQALSDGNVLSVDEIVAKAVRIMGLPDSVYEIESLYKGKPEIKYKIEWTLNMLKNKGLVLSPKLKYRKITSLGLEVLEKDLDISKLPDVPSQPEAGGDEGEDDASMSEEEDDKPDVWKDGQTFFDYLKANNLSFDTETVENFLLSLKAKQFVILSGGTGTGKTRLVQAYGEYLSGGRTEIKVETEVTLNKATTNNGFTISKRDFFSALPPEANRLDGEYRFELAGVESNGEIQMTPRLWIRNARNKDELYRAIEESKAKSDDGKATLTLWMPGSGTGERSYAIVPVGSNWTDGRFIVGYRNAISGKYSETPSLDLMIRADRDMYHPYLLILDEMNLSQVERYFSDVLSCMESGEPICLDSDGTGGVPKTVSLGSNLFVIGTVNMDETTHTFSPKVLDRANVIEFEPASVSAFLNSGPIEYDPKGDVDFLQDCMRGTECRDMNAKEIVAKISEKNQVAMGRLISDLDAIQSAMAGMKLPFGYRTLDEFMRFMYVAWVYCGRGQFDDWTRFADAQICQKILPKIHGSSSIRGGLEALLKVCADGGYARSEAKLRRMISMLETQRYVSFNC